MLEYFKKFREVAPDERLQWEILLKHERMFPNAGARMTLPDRAKDFNKEVEKLKKTVSISLCPPRPWPLRLTSTQINRLAHLKGIDVYALVSGSEFAYDRYPDMHKVIMTSNATGFAPEKLDVTNELATQAFGVHIQCVCPPPPQRLV